MSDLKKGYEKFRKIGFKQYEEQFLNLVKNGQTPKVLFIGCSDSRVVPYLITDTDPGDLFMIRNIGNFVPPFEPNSSYHSTAAAIEYAVSILKIEEIIICGHSHCGAIESLYLNNEDEDIIHVAKWLELGEGAKNTALDITKDLNNRRKLLENTERISVLFQMENLLTYPVVAKKREAGKLRIHGWYYKIEDGTIEFYNSQTRTYEPLHSSKVEI